MTEYTVPAFKIFIDDLRDHFAKELPETEHWEGVRGILKTLCADEQMREKSKDWPAGTTATLAKAWVCRPAQPSN